MPDELLERYMAEKDPVRNFEEYLLAEGVVTKEDIERGRRSGSTQTFEEGYEFAQASPFPEPGDVDQGPVGRGRLLGRASPVAAAGRRR